MSKKHYNLFHFPTRASPYGAAALLLILFISAGEAAALSNSGGGSWPYSRKITISNPGAALSDYQVLVSLDGGSFPTGAQDDGDDVRFMRAA